MTTNKSAKPRHGKCSDGDEGARVYTATHQQRFVSYRLMCFLYTKGNKLATTVLRTRSVDV